jgi:hypothetical protein
MPTNVLIEPSKKKEFPINLPSNQYKEHGWDKDK